MLLVELHTLCRVTLVHSHKDVLSMMRDEFRLLAQQQLEKIGVDIVLSDKVVNHADGQVSLIIFAAVLKRAHVLFDD